MQAKEDWTTESAKKVEMGVPGFAAKGELHVMSICLRDFPICLSVSLSSWKEYHLICC